MNYVIKLLQKDLSKTESAMEGLVPEYHPTLIKNYTNNIKDLKRVILFLKAGNIF